MKVLSILAVVAVAFTYSATASQVDRHASLLRLRRNAAIKEPVVLLAQTRRRHCSANKTSTHSSSLSKATPSATLTTGKLSQGQPANWPTKTQSGPTYSATAASPSDPNLLSVSDALNNQNNPLFTNQWTGDLTYYGQGLGACGDTYDDQSFTAAISHIMFDAWPGADTAAQNRNPVCGPFTPGRSVINNAGTFTSAVSSTLGSILIGGDGLPNCNPDPTIKCHIPLTATITNPATGKSAVVKIVDRCTGCAEGDIDVTPAVFASIADMSLGRVHGIQWHFNRY